MIAARSKTVEEAQKTIKRLSEEERDMGYLAAEEVNNNDLTEPKEKPSTDTKRGT